MSKLNFLKLNAFYSFCHKTGAPSKSSGDIKTTHSLRSELNEYSVVREHLVILRRG